jgi:hypothetical protein
MNKIKRHFIFTIGNVKISRMYGGSTYTATVYENKGRGKLVRLGERTACTRAHKGEPSEAWSVVMQDKRLFNRVKAAGLDTSYYSYQYAEKIGVKLEQI